MKDAKQQVRKIQKTKKTHIGSSIDEKIGIWWVQFSMANPYIHKQMKKLKRANKNRSNHKFHTINRHTSLFGSTSIPPLSFCFAYHNENKTSGGGVPTSAI